MLFLLREVLSFYFLTVCSCLSLRRCGELSGQAKAPGGDSQEAETGGT